MAHTEKVMQLMKEAQGMNEYQLGNVLSYLKSIKWISKNPGRSPAAEQKQARISDIINGRSDGTPEEVAALTAELENCISAAVWGMKE